MERQLVRIGLALSVVGAVAGCVSEREFDNREQEDFWNQAPNNEVDILWVVDDSSSMLEEQNTLAGGFVSFVGQMEASGTDFQIGVITTSFDYGDPNRGQLLGNPPILTADDDYVAEFAARAQVGVFGSDKEKGLEAAEWALSPSMVGAGGPNEGFLRPEAQLLIVFVSDEEDCSDRGALEGQPPAACYTQSQKLVPISEYVDAFENMKTEANRVLVGAIVGVHDGACNDAYASDRYSLIAGLTGGLVSDICLDDWSGVMTDLGLNATGVRNSFQLSHGAVPDTISVKVDGVKVPRDEVNGWTYEPTTWFITFGANAIPDRGAEISARYTVDPSAPAPG